MHGGSTTCVSDRDTFPETHKLKVGWVQHHWPVAVAIPFAISVPISVAFAATMGLLLFFLTRIANTSSFCCTFHGAAAATTTAALAFGFALALTLAFLK